MEDFIKLTRVTDWKVDDEKKKRTATGTMTVYIRPSEITQFSDDGDYTYVTLGDGSITVTEKADEIYKMIHKEERGYTPLIPSVPFTSPYRDPLKESKGWWYDFDWWNHPTITCDTISKNTPYYGYAIVFGNGEVWE